MSSLYLKMWRDRRGSIALITAIMAAVLVVSGIVAIDMTRIYATRTVLQAAVDNAAVAGASSYAMSTSPQDGVNSATATYDGSTASLKGLVMSNVLESVKAYCNSSSDSAPCGGVTVQPVLPCAAGVQYCVVVTAHMKLDNLLTAYITPTTWLEVQGVSGVNTTKIQVKSATFSATSVGSAYDFSSIGAYVVPQNPVTGQNEFANVPAANSNCTPQNSGSFGDEPNKTQVAANVQCNIAVIGSSTGGTFSTSISFQPGQYVAFAFANLTGATTPYATEVTDYKGNTWGSYMDPNSQYFDHISVASPSGGYQEYPNGACAIDNLETGDSSVAPVPQGTPLGLDECESYYLQNSGFSGGPFGIVQYAVPLYGECPITNFYGSPSIDPNDQVMNVGLPNFDFQSDQTIEYWSATSEDSLGVYSSAYEMLGYPPTEASNRLLQPYFSVISEPIQANGYFQFESPILVAGQCPHNSNANTTLAGYVESTTATTQVPDAPSGWAGLSVSNYTVSQAVPTYSTYYPGLPVWDNFTQADRNSDPDGILNYNYPPPLQSACSPANPTTYPSIAHTGPWWGWSPPPPGDFCSNQPTIAGSSTYDPANNNCALLIEPLGTPPSSSSNTPMMPGWFVEVKASNSASAPGIVLDPVYNNATWTDLYPGVENGLPSVEAQIPGGPNITASQETGQAIMTDSSPLGFYPQGMSPVSYPITSGAYAGDFAFVMNTAQGFNTLPADTSFRCYNPQLNGNTAPATYTTPAGYQLSNIGQKSVDNIENPQLGAVDCSNHPGQSFGLYWNDMGGENSDDLGYWNAMTVFTCGDPVMGGGSALTSSVTSLTG